MIKLLKRAIRASGRSTKKINPFVEQRTSSISGIPQLYGNSPRVTFCSDTKELAKYFKFDEDSEIIEKLFRGKHRMRHNFKRGDVVSNFHVEDVTLLKEFNICVYTLRHNSSRARYIHLDSCDLNNSFAIILHTPPVNDKGLALITQRLVMSGCEQYPVKDIIQHMAEKRSMNTFSEPWTGPEFTVFPFSTSNEKDFYNLLGVYIESVFRPLNRRIDFLQEGVRLEFDPEAPKKSSLTVHGGTYEEMFNNAQRSEQIFLDSIQRKIYAGSIYENSNGGRPEEIRKVEFQEILDYYQKHYSPMNANFYSYGDLDFTKHLEFIDGVLMRGKTFQKTEDNNNNYSTLPTKKEYVQENKLHCPAFNSDLPTGSVAITFLCNDIISDPEDTLGLSLLSYCLFEMPESIFLQEFLQSGMANKYCTGYGYDVTNRLSTFTIGFGEVADTEEELLVFSEKIMKLLKSISETGLDKEMLDFAIHHMEVSARETKQDFGLNLLQNIIPFIVHDANVTQVLQMEEHFKELKKKLEKGYLQKIVNKYFINNTHAIRTVMTPDILYTDTLKREENEFLQEKLETLTVQDTDFIQKDSQEVAGEMCKMQDVSMLPSLQLTDIVPLVEKFEYEESIIGGVKVWMSEQETNGLTYVRVKFDVSDLEPELHHFLQLFCLVFPHLGSSGLNTSQMDFLIDNYTAKFQMESHIFKDVKGSDNIQKILVLNLAYLDKHIEQGFSILNDLLSTPDFGNLSRISELLQYYAGIYANNLAENPMEMAIAHASAGLTKACYLNDQMKKTQDVCTLAVEALKTTALKQELTKISHFLQHIYAKMINQNRMSLLVHTPKKNAKSIEKRIELMLSTIKMSVPTFTRAETVQSDKSMNFPFKEQYLRSIVALPIHTNYIVESFKMPELINEGTPVMQIVGEIIKNCIHFEEIRSVEGVFDAGCYIDMNGTFNLYSFRDHHTIQRYETFERAIQYITNKDFTERELKESKVSLFGRIDKNIEPYNKGVKWFLYGLNDKLRLNYRQALLATNSLKIVDTAEKILVERIKQEQSSQVIFASQQHNLQKHLAKGWKIEKAVDGISVSAKSYKQNESQSFVFPEFM